MSLRISGSKTSQLEPNTLNKLAIIGEVVVSVFDINSPGLVVIAYLASEIITVSTNAS
jgi:hypothetical protein